ncbi:MAG TPA: ACT domain-containing protein [Chloroflexota bacterium]|jgi:hypothetical protein
MPQLFSVRLKNEPGALADLAQALAEHGIDIRTSSGGGVGSTGWATLSTNNDDAARDVLRRRRYTFSEGEILTVSVEDHPGSLARLMRRLADADVNVLGLVTLGRRQGKAELALAVDAIDKARRVLSS